MREGVQYYHRYLAAFHLQRYDLVVRDTERNLRLFAFVVRHAAGGRLVVAKVTNRYIDVDLTLPARI